MRPKKQAADVEPDPWKEKLQESLKKERPSPRRWGFWLGIALLAFMALLVWWLFPRRPATLPPLVTFDVLIPSGNPAPVRAVLAPSAAAPLPRGKSVVFQESRLTLPGEELSRAKVEVG